MRQGQRWPLPSFMKSRSPTFLDTSEQGGTYVWSIAFLLLYGALVVKSFKLRKRGRRLVPSGFATGDPWLRWPRRCVVTRRRYLNCTLSSFFADNLSTILTQQRLDLQPRQRNHFAQNCVNKQFDNFLPHLSAFSLNASGSLPNH